MTAAPVPVRRVFDELERPCDKFEHYFPLYERHLSRFVDRAPRILEIGVQHGGSAEMWRRWFGPGTRVDGVDIDPRCQETDYLRLVIGDQGSEEFWLDRFAGSEGRYDIVIDDGSHDNPHQILTLQRCYGMLADGGVYWCEDTHTSYYNGVRVRDGGYRNPRSFTEYAKQLVDVVNAHHTHHAIGVGDTPDGPHVPTDLLEAFSRMQGVHFYDSVVVVEKGERLTFERVIHGGAR